MSFFNTTARLMHVTPIPAGATVENVLEALHNHDLLIRLDPELAHYETLPTDNTTTASTTSPDSTEAPKRYKVTDHMQTLPKGLWGTTVTFEAQITNTAEGVVWDVKAPMGITQRSVWKVVRRDVLSQEQLEGVEEGHGDLFLVEDMEITASRFLTGTVKGKCEQNWRGVHARFVGQLKTST